MSNTIDLYFDYVMELIVESGKVMAEANDYADFELKKVDWDVVTKYDRKIEEMLIQKLKSHFPTHKFIGEEESADKEHINELTDDPTWIIDPIDGTANFIRHLPITCISVGLVIDKVQTIGVVYNPFMKQMFSAIKGRGAFLNGKRIYTSNIEDITKSLLNYELSLAKSPNLRDLYFSRFNHLNNHIMGIRSLGCAALGLCYVACGYTDAYQCDGLYPWDAAAGVLIVREAGGSVYDTSGGEFDLMRPNFIAAGTKKLAHAYLAVLKQADEEQLTSKQSCNAF